MEPDFILRLEIGVLSFDGIKRELKMIVPTNMRITGHQIWVRCFLSQVGYEKSSEKISSFFVYVNELNGELILTGSAVFVIFYSEEGERRLICEQHAVFIQI